METADLRGVIAASGGSAPSELPRESTAASPEPLKAPIPDIKEVDALLGALNKSGERVQTLWFSFLTALLYFAISAGTTTHRMLLLGEGINLPVLNVKLPLLPFYVIAPAFFLVLHFYMLMMLVLLARTASVFDARLRAVLQGEEQERYRMRIENTLFLQPLVGAERERKGVNARLLGMVGVVTLIVAPILLLLTMQLMFLPYHNWMTWWHRAMLALDLVFAWTLWPAFRWNGGELRWPVRRWSWLLSVPVTALVFAFAFCLATWPGETWNRTSEWHRNHIAQTVDRWGEKAAQWLFAASLKGISSNEERERWQAIQQKIDTKPSIILFGFDKEHSGAGNWIQDRRRGYFPNIIWLPNEVLVDAERLKIAEAQSSARKDGDAANDFGDDNHFAPTISLIGRDLTGANFSGASMRHVDFSSARFDFANFDNAWLHDSRLNDSIGQNAKFYGATLKNASLDFADLQYATFDRANLAGASLDSVLLQGASLGRANLQGAYLADANLRGAGMTMARLQRAWLGGADLQGAWLVGARLQGAIMRGANLRGAKLSKALFPHGWVELADFRETGLYVISPEGVWVSGAQMQGTYLDGAQLQGATLEGASLASSWGVPSRLTPNRFGAVDFVRPDPEESFDAWREAFMSTLPKGSPIRNKLKDQVALLGSAGSSNRRIDKDWWDQQRDLQESKWRPGSGLQREFRDVLAPLACDADAAPWVARRLLDSSSGIAQFADLGAADMRQLTTRLKQAAQSKATHVEDCPGGQGLTIDDLEKLDRLVSAAELRDRKAAPDQGQ